MLNLLFTFITSFIIAFASLPSVIRVARQKNIFDEPGERKLHKTRVPLLGGIAIFSAMFFSFLFWAARWFEQVNVFIIISFIILFFMTLLDDILPMSAILKLFIQIIAVSITVLFSNVRILGLHGLLGIHFIGYPASAVISLLFFLFIINAFNFIDGIDGLASLISIIASLCFGILFYQTSEMLMAILSFSLCGAVSAFLFFNISPAKIFMGDIGSVIIGFVMAVLTIHFTEITCRSAEANVFSLSSAPVIALAILIIPVTDFLRIFIYRIVRLRSPFEADNNHIHHRLLLLGLTHTQTTLLLALVNCVFISTAFLLRNQSSSWVFILLLITGILLGQLPVFFLWLKKKKSITQSPQQ